VNYLLWFFRFLVFVVLLAFAFKNTDPVTVRFYFGTQWEAPLFLVLLVAFALGAVGGVLASFGAVFRRRREIVGLRKKLRARNSEESQ